MNEDLQYQSFLSNGGNASYEEFLSLQIEMGIDLDSEKKKDNPNQNLAIGNPQSEMGLTTSVPISQDLDLNEAQIQAMNQVENPTLQSSDILPQQDSTDLPLIQTASSGLESSNILPTTDNLPPLNNVGDVPTPNKKSTFTFGDDSETVQLPKVESNLDILAGKSNDTDEISDESQQFFDKYLNKDYIDTKTQLSKQPFDTFGVSQDENEDNILLLEDKGIVEIKRDTEGNLVNENNKYVYKIIDKDYYDNVYSPYIDKKQQELTNQIKEQNVDSARFNFGNIGNEPEQDSYGEFVAKANDLGVLLSNEDSENITTYEDRQNFLATLEATNNAQKNGTTLQSELDKLGSKYLLSEEDKIANGYDGINLITNGIKDGKVKDKEESDFFNKFFTQKENVLDFGEYWNNEGKAKYGGSQVRENQANYQNYRANIFNDFLSYKNDKYGTDMRFIEEAVTKSSNLADRYYADGDFNAANVELAKVEKLYNQYNNNEANRQNISNIYTESNKAFTTYNKQKKEEAEFQLKVENGEFVANAKNILGQVALGVGSSVTSTITGLGRIVSSALPSDNLKDGLDIISDTELKVGNVKVASLTNKIKEFVGSDGLKYKEINGVTYLQNSDGKLSKNGYVQSGNEKVTKEDVEYNYGAGLTFVTSKMGADILITNAVGGGINRVLASSSTRLSNLKNIEKVFGLDSQVAKNAQSFAKLAKNTDNISVTGWYVQMYNDSYKMAEEGGINGNVNKHIYAMTQSLMQSVIQRINPDINFLKSMNTESRQIVRALMTNNKDKAIQLFSAFAKKAGNNVAKETGEEVIQQVVQDFNNVVINKLADTQLSTTDTQGYKEVVFGTVVPSIVASLMGGKGSRIANINNKEIDLTTYSRLDLITELARDKKGIEIVKDFKDTAYFPSQKQLGSDLENQIITAQKQIAKIPESDKYSTSALSEATPILQEIEKKKETLKTDDGTFSKKINEEIDLLVTKVNSILDNDLNPVTNNNAETTQSTPQSEAVQEQTAETRIDLNAKTGEELYVTEENSVEESPINTNQNETQEEQSEQVVSESSAESENITNETDIASVPQQDQNSNQVAEEVNEDDIVLPDDALDLINSLYLEDETAQIDNTTTDGNIQLPTNVVQQQGENNNPETTIEPTTSEGEVEVVPTETQATVLTEAERGRNDLVGMKTAYNKLSKAKKNQEDGKLMFARINELGKKLGYPIGSMGDGKISIKNPKTGKEMAKVKETFSEKIPTKKEVATAKKHLEDVAVWDGNTFNDHWESDLTWAEIRRGKQDIDNGKLSTVPARRLVNEINRQINDYGGFNFTKGSGNQTLKSFVSLDEIAELKNELPKVSAGLDLLTTQELENLYNERFESEKDFYTNRALQDENNVVYENGQGVQEESNGDDKSKAELESKKPIKTDNHQVFYNGKIVDMGYVPNAKEQFKYAGMRVSDNGADVGFIKTPKGEIFQVGKANKTAKKLSGVDFENANANFAQGVALQSTTQQFTPITQKAYDKLVDRLLGVFKKFGGKVETDLDKFKARAKELGFSDSDVDFMISRSRLSIPKVRGGWTKEKIIKYLKSNSSDTAGKLGVLEAIASYDTFEDFKDSIYYHGTTNFIAKGLKPSITMSEAEAERNGGGGYGERYYGVSLTKTKKTAESFSGQSNSVTVYPVLLKKDANIIVREDLQDANEVEEIVVDLYEQGVDAVWIGGGEQELVVINPKASMLYKNGRESFQVYGGFKSTQPTDAELKKVYEKAKEDYKEKSEQLKTKKGKEEREAFLNSIDNVQFMKTANGEIYGAKLPDGTIYLNPEKVNANTPIHEFSHLWQQLMPTRFKKGVEILKNTPIGKRTFAELKQNEGYANKSDAELWNEALVTVMGNEGERIFNSSKASKLKTWITDLFKSLGNAFGIRNLTPTDNLSVFVKGALKEVMGDKEIFAENGLNSDGNIDFQKPNPKPTYLMPKSLIEGITSSIRNGGKSDVIIALTKDSKWFNSLSEKKQNEFSVNDVKQILVDSVNYYKGADAVKLQETKDKAKAKLDKERAEIKAKEKASREKLAEVREESKDKITKLRDKYKEKIAVLRDENKDLRVKRFERKAIVRETIYELKSLLIGNNIDGRVTPSEISRLIRLASEVGASAKPTTALDTFFKEYAKIQEKAEARMEVQKNKELTADEYNQLKDIVEELLDKKTGTETIKDLVKTLNLPFSKANSISKEVYTTIDKIIARYETNQLSDEESANLLKDAYQQSKDNKNKREDERTKIEKVSDGLKKGLVKAIEKYSDRQFKAKELLNKIGALNTYNRLINSAGSSAKANELHTKIYDKVFKGLSNDARVKLNQIIVARRIISIEKNRAERDLSPINHTNNITLESAQKALKQFESENKVEYDDLLARSKEYFKAFDYQLDQMLDNGLITQEAYNGMKGVDYQPRMFLEHIADYQGNVEDGIGGSNYNTAKKGVDSKVIQSLDEGSIGKMVMDADWILRVAIASNTKMSAMNEVNMVFITKELPLAQAKYDLIQTVDADKRTKEDVQFIKYFENLRSQVKENPIMGYSRLGNPIFELKETPQGFTKNYFYIDGVRNEFFLADELHNIWNDIYEKRITKEVESNVISKTIFTAPTKLTKLMATGINPLFFIVNTPRDFFQIINFSDAYSNNVLKATGGLALDTYNAWKDTKAYDSGAENTMYAKYIEYGGGMDFLATQGKFDKKYADKNKILGALDTINTLSKYSEIGFRIATFSRGNQNGLKSYNEENGTSYKTVEEIPNSYDRDNIYHNSVRTARAVMDFNQGGKTAKDLDSMLPYLNASIQGTRSMVDAMRKNPYQTSYKMAQTATYMSGLVFGLMYGMFSLFDDDDDEKGSMEKIIDAYSRITPTQRANSWNIVLPNKVAKFLGFTLPDKKDIGEYYVLKIAKTQALAPLLYTVEEGFLNVAKLSLGKQQRSYLDIGKEAKDIANNNLLPFELANPTDMINSLVSKNFLGKAYITSVFGYDTYRKEKLSADIDQVPRGAEGLGNPNVEDFYKDFGKATGYSPVRTKAIVEGLITSPQTNPYVMATYTGLNVATNAMSKEDKEVISDKMVNDLKRMATGRLISQTSQYAKSLSTSTKNNKEKFEEVDYAYAERRAMVKELSTGLANGTMTKEYADQKVNDLKLTPNETKNLFNQINERLANKNVDSELFSIKYDRTSAEGKALRLIEAYPNINLVTDITPEALEIKAQIKQIGGIATDDVNTYYKKLIKEREEK